jgi:hypothetical protein
MQGASRSAHTSLTDAIRQRADKVLAYQDYNDAQPIVAGRLTSKPPS